MDVTELWIDANQGQTADNKVFGFVGTNETYEDEDGDDETYCGWFFTWPGSRAKITTETERQAVIDSLEIDDTEKHNEAIPHKLAVEKLTAYLAKRFPGDLDGDALRATLRTANQSTAHRVSDDACRDIRHV